MKTTTLALFVTIAAASAQDFVAPSGQRREIVPQVVEQRPTIEGIVKEIFITKRPWQAINPVAPASYGSGERFVSKDFGPGTPVHSRTVTVVGVEW